MVGPSVGSEGRHSRSQISTPVIGNGCRGGLPMPQPQGIETVWVNGVLSFSQRPRTGERGGRFLRRGDSFTDDSFES